MSTVEFVAVGQFTDIYGEAFTVGSCAIAPDTTHLVFFRLADLGAAPTDPKVIYPRVLSDPKYGDSFADQFRLGSINIYHLGYVYMMPTVGAFNMGTMGVCTFTNQPFGAFDDFAIWDIAGNDPTTGWVDAINDATSTTSGWTRSSIVFVPPANARFIAPHIMLGSMAASSIQYLDDFQAEVLPTGTTPATWQAPRTITATVNPTRLNYSTNPNFLNGTTGWTTTGTSLTQNTDAQYVYSGNSSAQVTISASGQTITHTISGLVLGITYTGAIQVYQNGVWSQITTSVLCSSTTAQAFTFKLPSASSYPATLYVGGCIIERGTTVGTYFDGNSGTDYLWETGGTAGSTRSYYYPDRTQRTYILNRVLQENVAMGLQVGTPVFAAGPPLT